MSRGFTIGSFVNGSPKRSFSQGTSIFSNKARRDRSCRWRMSFVAHRRVLTGVDIVDKYRSLTRSVITTDRQTASEKTVLSLDALDEATS